MTTSFDLYAKGQAPFLLSTKRSVDLEAIPTVKNLIERAKLLAADQSPDVRRKYGTQPPIKFIRISGRGEIYCALAGSENLEKLRMTYRLHSSDRRLPTLTIYMPCANNGTMLEKELERTIEEVLQYASIAIQIVENIDLDENNLQMERITDAYSTFASSSLPQSPQPYDITTTFPTPHYKDKGFFGFKASDEEVETLAGIGPALLMDTLSHNPETGDATLSLARLSWFTQATGPFPAFDRLAAYQILRDETLLGREVS